ncbi:MAG TPA: class I SAM-dependent methyltransferase [Solirubrobacteraceae bacterium]|nr:class I SAM-dependent methyltransferase [Solirubrobacteraceae bacterium]
MWMPLDVDRVAELPWAAAALTHCRPKRVLDIASPKLLAAWLAEHTDAEVVATDLWDAEIARWRRLVGAADPAGRRFAQLKLETADGTNLPQADGSFDAAYCVSVIEHIPEQGDTTAIKELGRVLRPGGTLVLTFPFGATAAEVRVEHDLYGQRYQAESLFFYRRYSPDTVAARLLATGEFETVGRAYWRKSGVQSAQTWLHRLTPARWELGRALGPMLSVVGKRALVPHPPEDPGDDGVLGLVLRRTAS